MDLFAFLLLSSVITVLRLFYERYRDRKLPPGPPRLPFVGNLLQMPLKKQWLKFDEWSRKYGPIFSLNLAGSVYVVISDPQIASRVLEKRSASDRPRMTMFQDNVGKGMYNSYGMYDEGYRLHQRMQGPVMSRRAAQTYSSVQELETKHTLYEMLSSNDYKKLYTRFNASVIFSLVYGKRIITGEETELKEWLQRHHNFTMVTASPWLVDFLPILNHIVPKFLAPWKKLGDEMASFESRVLLRHMKMGLQSSSWNWAKEFTASPEGRQVSPLQIAYDLGLLIDAGLETTSTIMEVFTLAAIVAPEAIRKAQEELDRVVGPTRLPSLEDRERLPYMSAVVDETQRWRLISPLMFPHGMMEEDTCLGYTIPKGATVFALGYTMSLDASKFDRPLEFRPERWLEKVENGRFNNFFGYGRRGCAGRDIGKNSLFLLFSSILWAYNIKNGDSKAPDDRASSSALITVPQEFKVIFEPRSTHHRMMVESEWVNAEKDIDLLMQEIKERQTKLGIGHEK
jgi:cytochrome P450